jgi:hypothetical protein
LLVAVVWYVDLVDHPGSTIAIGIPKSKAAPVTTVHGLRSTIVYLFFLRAVEQKIPPTA